MSELDKKIQSSGVFNFSRTGKSESKIVMFGAPMDYTVSFKAGSRFGPQAVRNASYGLEEYSPYKDRHLSEVPFYDEGDLILPIGNVDKSLDRIYRKTKQLLKEVKIPLVIGGEHLLTLPVVKAMAEHYPDLILVQFDAHTDLRDTFFGEKNSHATVIRRCAEVLGPGRVWQYGIRSGERHEFQYADKMTRMTRYEVLRNLKQDAAQWKGKPVYVTFDIDVIDPSFCPGTGTPEPGGITIGEALEALHLLENQNVVGMDLVEVSPERDQAGVTAIAAAKLLREAMVTFWWPGRGKAFQREQKLEKRDNESLSMIQMESNGKTGENHERLWQSI